MHKRNKINLETGFTIVELLVVIVVIGILAAITIISYVGIAQKAKIASFQSDLTNASKQIKLFQVTSNSESYPDTINCAIPDSLINKCVKASGTNSFSYTPQNSAIPKTFTLDVTDGSSLIYRITNDSLPIAVVALSCPSGFIVVPGSGTYGTSDFCVMKYEAKNVSGIATSQVAGTPWTDITQPTAITTSAAACSGCHLINEAEWMTIAKNVLGVASNWTGGSVGSGSMYIGHSDNSPANALVADAGGDGYFNTGNTTGSTQRRTLTLSNGEIIWDLAGNVFELTSGSASAGKPGISGGGWGNRDWTTVTNLGSLTPNISPAGTGISGASGWGNSQGMGVISSDADDATAKVFIRGGYWGLDLSMSGIFSVNIGQTAGGTSSPATGFRVAK